MGTINPCRAIWALLYILSLCGAQDTEPVATEPIVSAVTVSTVVPSLLTIYSVVTSTSTESVAASIATITTVISGSQTTLVSTVSGEANARPVVIQTITNTIISTISVTTTEVIQSTVGFTTIFGATSNQQPTSDIIDLTAAGTASGLVITSTGGVGTAVVYTLDPSATSFATTGVTNPDATTTSPSLSAESSSAASSSGGGLSAGAKAGIAIGAILGVTTLVVAGFLLGQRYSRRRSAEGHHTESLPDATVHEKDAFQAGRPYELTGSNRQPTEMSTGKMHPYSFTTAETTSGSESVSGKSYEMPGCGVSPSYSAYNEPAELSALPQFDKKDDAPMYVGVPAHMSGSKRWSVKEYEKS